MSRAYPFLVGAILSLCSSQLFAQNLSDVVEKAEQSLLKIEVENVGQGSGFVVDESGIAVTNVHVMAGAQDNRAIATFPNGTTCEITGSYIIDEGRDIAVIQLKLDSLPVLPMATDLPRKGDEVLALGSPMGLSFTATRGIVSAIRSEEEMKQDLGDSTICGTWVQVDAPLSPGNSGGPLINKDGELVAMSTKASIGQAQNLNFGISVTDVKIAVEKAKGRSLVSLSNGLGKVDMEEVRPKSGEIVKRVPIPRHAISEYLERGRDEFSYLTRGLRQEITLQRELLKKMRSGKIEFGLEHDVARDARLGRFYYRDEQVKSAEVKRQEERVRELDRVMDKIGKAPTDQAIYALLWQYGPTVNMRRKGSVGFLSNAKVVIALTENDVVVEYDGGRYLLWVKDASGLGPGDDVTPSPVFVAGSRTIEIPTGGSIAVTILNSVLESELKSVVLGTAEGNTVADGIAGADEIKQIVETSQQFRKWKDTTGKFEVEASLVTKDDTKVVLQKKDGTIITVQIKKLSVGDRDYLESR